MKKIEEGSPKITWYDSSQQGLLVFSELIELFRYRFLIIQLIKRDILTRYKRSVLGVAWTMLNPLGMMLVLTVAFSQVFRFNVPNYPVYVLSGLIFWNFFAQTTTMTMTSTVWGGGLFKRIYIPRASFAISSLGTGLVNLLFALFPLLIIMLFSGIPIPITIFLTPIPILFLLMFSLGVGLIISTIAIYFPDVAEMYQIGLSAWMYLTPIIYPSTLLPENIRFWIELLNPMYRLVHLFRYFVFEGKIPPFTDFLIPFLVTAGILIIGWFLFTKKSDEFPYRV